MIIYIAKQSFASKCRPKPEFGSEDVEAGLLNDIKPREGRHVYRKLKKRKNTNPVRGGTFLLILEVRFYIMFCGTRCPALLSALDCEIQGDQLVAISKPRKGRHVYRKPKKGKILTPLGVEHALADLATHFYIIFYGTRCPALLSALDCEIQGDQGIMSVSPEHPTNV